MGFLATDVNILSTTGPTVLIPTSKDQDCKLVQVTRADTAATVKAVLPADASVIGVKFFGSTASNASLTATVTLTLANNTGTISTGTVDVIANGATTAEVQMSALPNLENIPSLLTGDIKFSATYAETGIASTAGGPWYVLITYVR
ncbi:MAG: hypothetical protein KGI54_14225 [Pseudomonadota bacterium]|nr:hypothetical protein [Pseudomonadota bacterium]